MGGPGPERSRGCARLLGKQGARVLNRTRRPRDPFEAPPGHRTPRAGPKPRPHPALPLPGAWLPSSLVTSFRSRVTAFRLWLGERLSVVDCSLSPEALTLSPARRLPCGPPALAASSIGPQVGRYPVPLRPAPPRPSLSGTRVPGVMLRGRGGAGPRSCSARRSPFSLPCVS